MSDCSFRALIVDDDPTTHHLLPLAFGREGFLCDVATSGAQALDLCRERRYDVVVTDLDVPDMNGRRLVRELLSCMSGSRIIVHTAEIAPKIARELIAEGVDDIVCKPLDYALFASKIWAVLVRNHQKATYQPSDCGTQFATGNPLASQALGEPDRERVGSFQLKRQLGAGAMGEVYEAEQFPLGRPCAIKLMKASLSSDSVARARFEREARAVAGLSHWNTVRVFDFGATSHGRFYYAMELVPGESLEDIVAVSGPLPPERVIHLLLQTCDALHEAHQVGLIHRDLKPSNIMAVRDPGRYDVVKVVDFGLAKECLCKNLNDVTVLTQSGSICGSPGYMAPEQVLESTTLDHRVDIYSLGITAFFLTTGRLPFPETATVRTLMAHVNDKVPHPSTINLDLPKDLECVILKCLEKAPEDRFESVQKLRQALERCESAMKWTQRQAKHWWEQVYREDAARARFWQDDTSLVLASEIPVDNDQLVKA
ncbi:MAG: protein kinase [Planctomycetaceae bacterium]|nr:protein kinase [Planctomycetaceae bacterium]